MLKHFWITLGLLLIVIMAGSGLAQNGIVSLDNITYAGYDQIRAGHRHQVSIRYNCLGLSSTSPWNGVTSYEVYSPDGADWGFLRGAAGPLVEGNDDLIFFINHYEYDGSTWSRTGNNGADSAGGSTGLYSRAAVSIATLSFVGGGFIGGLDNDIAVILEFVTDPAQSVQDLHICIDTVSQLGVGGGWEWAAGGSTAFPLWDNGLGISGPRCFELWHDCCCQERVGDPNMTGDEPTIGDVSLIVEAKFISGDCYGVIKCLQEADVNQSGGHVPTCDDITIGDISTLIDYLFVTGESLGLPNCEDAR